MKRGKTARLVLMATAPIVLSACSNKEPAVIYSSVDACTRDLQLDAQSCTAEYQDAMAQHQKSAPRYGSRSDCEADFGTDHCEYNPSSMGSFMPMMMGFMAAKAMQNSNAFRPAPPREENCANPPCTSGTGGGGGYAGGRWRAQPLYRSADDTVNWRTANNTNLGSRSGAVDVDSAATRPAFARTVSRGGFGKQAAMRAGFSSGG